MTNRTSTQRGRARQTRPAPGPLTSYFELWGGTAVPREKVWRLSQHLAGDTAYSALAVVPPCEENATAMPAAPNARWIMLSTML